MPFVNAQSPAGRSTFPENLLSRGDPFERFDKHLISGRVETSRWCAACRAITKNTRHRVPAPDVPTLGETAIENKPLRTPGTPMFYSAPSDSHSIRSYRHPSRATRAPVPCILPIYGRRCSPVSSENFVQLTIMLGIECILREVIVPVVEPMVSLSTRRFYVFDYIR